MKKKPQSFGRRALLRGGLAAGAMLGLGPLARLTAQVPGEHRLITVFFSGGWDILLGPDARDPARSYPGIDLGTDLLPPRLRDPIEVTLGGKRRLWGAPMRAVAAHADRVTLFSGVNMNTVAHPIGQAYAATYRRPGGTTARGTDLGTIVAANAPTEVILPHVSISRATYNDAYTQRATAVSLRQPSDLSGLLAEPTRRLPQAIEDLLSEAKAAADPCIAPTYRAPSPVIDFQLSEERLRAAREGRLSSRFAFDADTPEMSRLRTLYGFTSRDRNTPALRAAAAAQLIRMGLSSSVTFTINTRGCDTHSNWPTLQPQALEPAFAALAAMVTDIRDTFDPDLDRTTIVVTSEFSRTPRINGRQGRDHWFANSVLILGRSLRPGVFGATNADDLGLLPIDRKTGDPSSSGTVYVPELIGATLAESFGLDSSAYRSEPLREWIA